MIIDIDFLDFIVIYSYRIWISLREIFCISLGRGTSCVIFICILYSLSYMWQITMDERTIPDFLGKTNKIILHFVHNIRAQNLNDFNLKYKNSTYILSLFNAFFLTYH